MYMHTVYYITVRCYVHAYSLLYNRTLSCTCIAVYYITVRRYAHALPYTIQPYVVMYMHALPYTI